MIETIESTGGIPTEPDNKPVPAAESNVELEVEPEFAPPTLNCVFD